MLRHETWKKEIYHHNDHIPYIFSKAFDKVSHQKLTAKLAYYGIRGNTNAWISDFLHERTQTVVLDGVKSYDGEVLSGVPQGSVLGPCLFLYYINDIPLGLNSTVRLFADDTVVYLAVKTTTDAITLQNDLHKLEQWEDKWAMEFNPSKCQVMHISRNKKPSKHEYTLHGTTLEAVDAAKYLGVTITPKLNFNKHIDNVTASATRSLNFLKRNLQVSSPKLKITAYNALVRPLLEYAPTVWNPYTSTYIKKVEMVQRRAARYTLHRYHYTSSVGEMLQQLGWQTLQQRREQQSLCMMYKIHYGLVAFNKAQYLIPAQQTRRTTHGLAYQIPHSRTDYHLNSFFPRTIRLWNSLPGYVVITPTYDTFRNQLASYYAAGPKTM